MVMFTKVVLALLEGSFKIMLLQPCFSDEYPQPDPLVTDQVPGSPFKNCVFSISLKIELLTGTDPINNY